jgi:hypothetical protein
MLLSAAARRLGYAPANLLTELAKERSCSKPNDWEMAAEKYSADRDLTAIRRPSKIRSCASLPNRARAG